MRKDSDQRLRRFREEVEADYIHAMHHDPARTVLRAARRAAKASERPMLLAVSGGLDSMSLMSAMAAAARGRIAAVATFDHGTGAAATAATHLVRRHAAAAGLPVVVGRGDPHAVPRDGREAMWRAARYAFLDSAAEQLGARVVTAHTEDDQVETVLMRIMRGSGARGLAGLYATSDHARPFLALRRAELRTYAIACGVPWVDDPSNDSPAFARNRLRHDLLPALRRVEPAIDAELLSVARRACTLREEVDGFVADRLRPEVQGDGRVEVAVSALAGHGPDARALLWNAVAARAGLSLDRRGTRRIVAFTNQTARPRTGSIPLAGGWCLEARRTVYILRKDRGAAVEAAAPLPLDGMLHWGPFRFRIGAEADDTSPWAATLASGGGMVRAWNAGDRLAPSGGHTARRVKRYLTEQGVQGRDRVGWPVVVAGDEIVWIPGVRRSDAATDRSGRPVLHYVCERTDR